MDEVEDDWDISPRHVRDNHGQWLVGYKPFSHLRPDFRRDVTVSKLAVRDSVVEICQVLPVEDTTDEVVVIRDGKTCKDNIGRKAPLVKAKWTIDLDVSQRRKVKPLGEDFTFSVCGGSSGSWCNYHQSAERWQR